MNLRCPFCTEDISYDHRLGGKTVECSYCKKSFLMPLFDKLPPESQQEYRAEIDKIQRKRQALEQKKQEQVRREQEQMQQEAIRQEADRQQKIRDLEVQAQNQKWNSKIEQAKESVPEDFIVAKDYPILKGFARFFRFLGYVSLCVAGLGIIFIWIDNSNVDIRMDTNIFKKVLVSITIGFFSISYAVLCWLIAEIIILFVNIADDIRISRALLKRTAYKQTPLP